MKVDIDLVSYIGREKGSKEGWFWIYLRMWYIDRED